MDPTVVAAWIAVGVSVLTLVGTLTAQYLGYRATSRDAGKTSEEQRKQLVRTLAEQPAAGPDPGRAADENTQRAVHHRG
jgi:hypothetical protein